MKNISFYFLMLIFDFSFSNFVVLNLVIFVWRIIWDSQDMYLSDNDASKALNYTISIIMSFVILVLVKIKQIQNAHSFSLTDAEQHENEQKMSSKIEIDQDKKGSYKKSKKVSRIIKYSPQLKCFILIFSLANINLWRGIWYLTMLYTKDSTIGYLTIGIISIIALIAMNRACALVAVPFIFAKDCSDSAYQINPSTNKTHVCLKIEQELKVSQIKTCEYSYKFKI
jgi:hypothetical protein